MILFWTSRLLTKKMLTRPTAAWTPPNCRPPWLDTIIPWTSCFKASFESPHVNIPFTKIGNFVLLRNQSILPQLKSDLIFLNQYDTNPGPFLLGTPSKPLKFSKFPYFKCVGSLNPYLLSSSLILDIGLSTVTAIAL